MLLASTATAFSSVVGKEVVCEAAKKDEEALKAAATGQCLNWMLAGPVQPVLSMDACMAMQNDGDLKPVLGEVKKVCGFAPTSGDGKTGDRKLTPTSGGGKTGGGKKKPVPKKKAAPKKKKPSKKTAPKKKAGKSKKKDDGQTDGPPPEAKAFCKAVRVVPGPEADKECRRWKPAPEGTGEGKSLLGAVNCLALLDSAAPTPAFHEAAKLCRFCFDEDLVTMFPLDHPRAKCPAAKKFKSAAGKKDQKGGGSKNDKGGSKKNVVGKKKVVSKKKKAPPTKKNNGKRAGGGSNKKGKKSGNSKRGGKSGKSRRLVYV